MNKQELRISLLEGMCDFAEDVETIYSFGEEGVEIKCPGGIYFLGICPSGFKPSIADRFLFNKFIDKVLDNILGELQENPKITPSRIIMGANILSRTYYPYYGWCDVPNNQ